jgi:hypothetical protein
MMERFTDAARSAIRAGFSGQPAATERDVIVAVADQGRGLARLLHSAVGAAADDWPADTVSVERHALIVQAGKEAQRRGVPYVGAEHLLLAVARLPGSALPRRGLSADHLEEQLSAAESGLRRGKHTRARRLGAACRSALRRLRGRP